MHTPTRSAADLSAYDSILGPTLRQHTGTDTTRAALAVAVRGLAATPPLHREAVRLWLRSRGGERFALMTRDPRAFSPIVSKGRAKVAASSLPGAREEMALKVARALVGFTLQPVEVRPGLTAHTVVGARHAFAVMSRALLDSCLDEGRDTVLVSSRWLAVQMGCERGRAMRLMRAVEALGWLRLVSSRAGGSRRYRAPSRLPQRVTNVVWTHAVAVDALLDRRLDVDPLADLLLTVPHAGWGHGLGGKVWLFAVADAAQVDPRTLGLAPRSVAAARRQWIGFWLDQPEGTPLLDALRAHAATGPAEAKQNAEAARREAAAARAAETAAHREVKAVAYAARTDLLAAHPAPKPTAPVAKRNAWVTDAQAFIAARDLSAPALALFARALATTLRADRLGYTAEVAERVARVVAGLPADEAGAAA